MIEPFKNPGLDRPTPIRILEDGTVYGHACEWARMHTAIRGVTPPRTDGAYRFFHLGGYQWKGQDVDVGSITLHTLHADLRLPGDEARAHYENTGSVAAYVRAGDDEHGVWFCGRLRSGLADEDVEALRGAKVSGDWRGYNGQRELIGMLAVNVPGFPVERERVLVAGGLALVASGVVPLDVKEARGRLRVANLRFKLRASSRSRL
jgi:hypothetical protein